MKSVGAEAPAGRPAGKPEDAARAIRTAHKKEKKEEKRPPKATEPTPELLEQIEQIYREQYAGSGAQWLEMVAQISDKLWLDRKAVNAALRDIVYPKVTVTPELKDRIIEMYRGYVERGERPPDGRRKTIGRMFGVPFGQVKDIVFEWSRSQYEQSPTPDLSREQKFAVEKLYLDELSKGRYRLFELPAKIAGELGFVTPYQVSRWLDKLYDDDSRFKNVADLPPEIEQRIIEAYRQYLASPKPPERGLHETIAQQIGEITKRQVHSVLQKFRKQRRSEYPLQ